MPFVLENTLSGDRYAVFTIEIEKDGSLASPFSFFVTSDRADYEAKRISQAMPDYRVGLLTMARFKAFYRNGVRVGDVKDYRRDFYIDLTDEEYAATKIQDSSTAEWI